MSLTSLGSASAGGQAREAHVVPCQQTPSLGSLPPSVWRSRCSPAPPPRCLGPAGVVTGEEATVTFIVGQQEPIGNFEE